MKVNLKNSGAQRITDVATRCPHCGHYGAFVSVGLSDVYTYRYAPQHGHVPDIYLGIRRCPNEKCCGHLFFISRGSEVLETSPSETIPFEKEKIPQRILIAFEEAIKCHSISCFIASAIMIRKTLEEICVERGAKGGNLLQKIQALGKKILIPQELLTGMDELRLLGNDAAHIEAKTFDEIGKEEVELSLEFTKEILKAVYQYENLLQRIRDLKNKTGAQSNPLD